MFDTLPTELLEKIFLLVDLPSLASLMQASKSSYNLLHSIIDDITLQHTQSGGDLYWILPVDSVPKETERALGVVRTWKSFEGSTVSEWLQCAGFPWFAFVRQCFVSDSMRNRRRMWDVSEQLRRLLEAVSVDVRPDTAEG